MMDEDIKNMEKSMGSFGVNKRDKLLQWLGSATDIKANEKQVRFIITAFLYDELNNHD